MTAAEDVRSREAMEAAFLMALISTFTGSMIPSATISTQLRVRALYPIPLDADLHLSQMRSPDTPADLLIGWGKRGLMMHLLVGWGHMKALCGG